jgi:Domain of unknown function (DUF4386)
MSFCLLDVAQLLGSAVLSTLQPEQLHAQMMSSTASFDNGWVGIGLAIFGLHLLGLGALLFRSAHFPRFLGVLVAIAGGGYLVDSSGTILVPDYALTIGALRSLAKRCSSSGCSGEPSRDSHPNRKVLAHR